MSFFMRKLILTILLGLQPLVAWGDTHRIAVILVDFPDSVESPTVIDQTRLDMACVDAGFAENSYGQFVSQSDIFGVYRVNLDQTASRAAVAQAAQQAAAANGADLSVYDLWLYVSPTTETVKAGYADRFGAWIARLPGMVAAPGCTTAIHELTHEAGNLSHDGSVQCDAGPLAGNCLFEEYGNTLSYMGSGSGHMSPQFKYGFGWLTPQDITRSGDYFLSPYETVDGVKALRIVGGTRKFPLAFWLAYYQPIGMDSHLSWVDLDNVYHGVVITRIISLMKFHPNIAYSNIIDHPAMLVGDPPWCEPGGKFSVSVVSVSPSGAVVRVLWKRC